MRTRAAHRSDRRPRKPIGSTKAAASAVLAVALLAAGVTAANAAGAPGGGTTLGMWDFKTGAAPAGYSFLDRACLTEAENTDRLTCQNAHSDDRDLDPGPIPLPSASRDSGWLQLTAKTTGRAWEGVAGSLLYDKPLPASAGLVVTFDQVQYGGTGADGIAFFLTDGTYNLINPGGSGGSLGYAQRGADDNASNGPIAPGVAGGYLGVGLDAYGNFSNDNEARGRGCESRAIQSSVPAEYLSPNAVSLRGPGRLKTQSPIDGDTYPATDWVNGYCLLASTNLSTAPGLPVGASLRSTLPGPPSDTSGTTAAMQRRVQVSITPQPDNSTTGPAVTVSMDFGSGTFVQVLTATMPTPAPPTYKFGFSASTGGQTDVHLVRNVHVDTQVPLKELSVTKQIPNGGAHPGGYVIGETIPYEYVVYNTGASTVTELGIDDPSVAAPSCQTSVLLPGASTICTGTHVVTAQDLQDSVDAAVTPGDPLVYSEPATAHGKVPGETLISPESFAPATLTAPHGTITTTATLVYDADNDGLADIGDVVHWTYTVVNDSAVDLHDVTIQTANGDVLACGTVDLARGDTFTCDEPSVVTLVTDDDIANGTVSSTAWARGSVAGVGTTVTTAPSTAFVTVDPPAVPTDPTDPPTGPTDPRDPPADPTDPPAVPSDPTAGPTDPPAVPTDPTDQASADDPTAQASADDDLANTGSDLTPGFVGAAALLLGAAAVAFSRRRRA
ncbi:LPXTG cell wall anchor domain-containing protein [Cellulomonas sp. URHD0024]|uniref:DUF7507 domain-containing protein n=1 Tax=Cellulomonas sp. URHD0024 TaxID=1302620 RepID=UPI0003FA3B31|nr:LPXTG cell wall anchor domain-containing protein [Cellulomonas sp. URHD0024]